MKIKKEGLKKTMVINELNIENIYFVSDGKIILTSDYKNNDVDSFSLYDLAGNLKSIEHYFTKATKATKEKYIKNNKSFYISTNKRDYDNTIIYDLYIACDVATIEQLEDKIEKGTLSGEEKFKKQYKLVSKYDCVYSLFKWSSITKERYDELYKNYEKQMRWSSLNELKENSYSFVIDLAKKELEKDPFDKYANAKLNHAKKELEKGFYASHYERVEERKKELVFCGYVYKTTKDKNALMRDKITKLMKEKVKDTISNYDIERMLKYFNITIKKGV